MAGTDAEEIVVNVRLLPEEKPAHTHLTRFQRGRRGEVTGPTLRLTCKTTDTVATLKKLILGARGEPVESLRRGGSPEGIILSPDTATLAECGVTRSMGVWEHLWEDSAANQASFRQDKDKVRGMVTSFMEEFPAVGRAGKAVTGEEENGDESEGWDEGMKKKRAEMEAAVAAAKSKKKSALEEVAGGGDAAAPAAAAEEDKKEEKDAEAAPPAAAAAAIA